MLLGDIKDSLLLAIYEDFLAQFMTKKNSNITQFSKISLALRSFYLKLDLYVYRNLKDGQLKGIRIVN